MDFDIINVISYTQIMKQLYDEKNTEFSQESIQLRQKEFSDDDICVLKALFLEIEKIIDSIELTNSTNDKKMEGSYVFRLLQGADVSTFIFKKLFFN